MKPMPNRNIAFGFSTFPYTYRNLAEWLVRNTKHSRAVAARYDEDTQRFIIEAELIAANINLLAYIILRPNGLRHAYIMSKSRSKHDHYGAK